MLGVLLFNSSPQSWLYVSYQMNKLEIIEQFCINKDVEEYTCEGKCHLNKQIKQVEQKQNEFPLELLSEERLTLFPVSFNVLQATFQTQTIIGNTPYLNSYRSISLVPLTPPPRFLS